MDNKIEGVKEKSNSLILVMAMLFWILDNSEVQLVAFYVILRT